MVPARHEASALGVQVMRQGLGSLLLTGWAVGSASAVLYSLDDCNRVKLGCWQDSKPGDKVPGATGKRVLPYAWCPQVRPWAHPLHRLGTHSTSPCPQH